LRSFNFQLRRHVTLFCVKRRTFPSIVIEKNYTLRTSTRQRHTIQINLIVAHSKTKVRFFRKHRIVGLDSCRVVLMARWHWRHLYPRPIATMTDRFYIYIRAYAVIGKAGIACYVRPTGNSSSRLCLLFYLCPVHRFATSCSQSSKKQRSIRSCCPRHKKPLQKKERKETYFISSSRAFFSTSSSISKASAISL